MLEPAGFASTLLTIPLYPLKADATRGEAISIAPTDCWRLSRPKCAHAAFRTVVKLVSLRVLFCAAVAHFHPSANSCHRTDTSFAPFVRPLLDSSGGPTSIASLTRQN